MADRRVFFALWPDDGVRKHLDAIAQSNRPEKSRPIRRGNLHATLNFLGNLPEERIPDLLEAASGVRGRHCVLELTKLEVWRRSAVLALCPDTVPDVLVQLHAKLDHRLIEAGFETESRKYRPHVTLARKARVKMDPVYLDTPLKWVVDEFVLVESVSISDGVRYDVLERWELGS
ncbi:MAG: RNA 2',3'-cyclic phosphodiesterase [Gammaproteobacteria bacterium]|nr:MAG: RNA 2',3'-cyclic phosphodiesterase [Gammaproteobacteria bacterium]